MYTHPAESWSNLGDSTAHCNTYRHAAMCIIIVYLLEDHRMPKAVVIEMRLIVQRDHMQTDFRFQLSLFIIKLGEKKFCGYYRIRLTIWYALFPLQNRNWPLNHCLNFCCPWNMIVNSLNVPVLLWSLTTSSLTFFLVLLCASEIPECVTKSPTRPFQKRS